MLKWRMFLTFLSILLSVMGGVHWYVFTRLVRDTALPAPWPWAVGLFLVVAVLSIPLSFMAGRTLDKSLARFIVVPAYLWMGFVFQTFFLLLALDGLRILSWVAALVVGGPPLFPGPSENLGFWRVAAGMAVSVTALATLFGVWWGLTRMAVRRIEIHIRGLPEEMDGFSIAHLSDLHLDLVHGAKWLRAVVEKTNTLTPDLIAITGDLAEGSVRQFEKEVEPLRDLKAPEGVFFVTGNHEYFHDLNGWLDHLGRMGVRVLRNERTSIGTHDAGFDLAGVDDHDGTRIAPGHGPDLRSALDGRDRDRPVVLMAHQPRIIQEASEAGVDLVLSGHTHGGQIWPFGYLVYLQQPYVRGLKKRGETYLYLSSGTGFWGPPMRLGTTAEIALITLRSKPTSASSSA